MLLSESSSIYPVLAQCRPLWLSVQNSSLSYGSHTIKNDSSKLYYRIKQRHSHVRSPTVFLTHADSNLDNQSHYSTSFLSFPIPSAVCCVHSSHFMKISLAFQNVFLRLHCTFESLGENRFEKCNLGEQLHIETKIKQEAAKFCFAASFSLALHPSVPY